MPERPISKNILASQETREMRYERLRADVQQWIEGEQEKKRAWIELGRPDGEDRAYDPHTDGINHLHLTEIDLDLWEKMQNQGHGQAFPIEDWERYDIEFRASIDSRSNFRAAMGNEVAAREIISSRRKPK